MGAFALSLALAGCSGGTTSGASSPPKPVPDSALDGLLLSVDEVNGIMGTTGMQQHATVRQMADHRNMLPNLDCLGVWQVNEAPVYDSSHWKSVRQKLFRVPDTDAWDSLLVQSVVSYRTADGADEFFTQSADRWSRCTNHNVNIRSTTNRCQRGRVATSPGPTSTVDALHPWQRRPDALVSKVHQDRRQPDPRREACKPQQPARRRPLEAAEIGDKIESKLPR